MESPSEEIGAAIPEEEELVEKDEVDVIDEATASASEYGNDDDFDETVMPMLKYTRIHGSLPRIPRQVPSTTPSKPLSSPLSCARFGKVLLPQEDADPQHDLPRQPVLLTGYEDGSVTFVNVESGSAVIEAKQLLVDDSSREHPAIVDVSLDASANFLAAINTAGVCAIWEVRYGRSSAAVPMPDAVPPPPASPGEENVFKNFLQAMTPGGNNSGDAQISNRSLHGLKTTSVQASRVTYPSSYGRPTCLCLDPSYKRRREKAMLVAFSDGRLVLSKKGMFRRNDAVLHQAASGGIEAIEWRGAVVAWADGR